MADEAVTAGSAKELTALYPVAKEFDIAGRKVEIPAASIRHCTEVYQRGLALAGLMAAAEATDLIYADEHPDEYADFLAFATALDRDWILGLTPFDKIAIYRAWLEVNGAFFVQRVLPAQAALQETVAAMFGLGPISSSSAEPAGTPTPTTTPPKPSKRGQSSSVATSDADSAIVS